MSLFSLGVFVNLDEYIGADTSHQFKRIGLTSDFYTKGIDAFVTNQLSLIDRELQLIAIEAHVACDKFWDFINATRADYEGYESITRIGTRIRVKDRSLIAEWYRNRFAPGEEGAPKKVYSTYIRKGKGYSYPLYAFSNEPKWVRDQVAITEREYARLREKAARLSKIRSAVMEYAAFSSKPRTNKEGELV